MNRPKTILVIGPTRSATTALWKGLKDIENVSVATTKENYFFSRRVSEKANVGYTQYLAKNFSGEINVDFEPSIFHSNEQLSEAFRSKEVSNFIGILRKPIDLYASSYRYNLRNGIKYNGFEEFFDRNRSHYSFRRVELTAEHEGVTISWLPHEDVMTDPRLFLFASGIPYDYSVAWTLTQLNGSSTQVSAVGRLIKKARALKKVELVRQASERLRGNQVFERLLYRPSKGVDAIPERELKAVNEKLVEEDEFFYYLRENAKTKILVDFKKIVT